MASLRSCKVLGKDPKQVLLTFYKGMSSTSKDKHELMLEAHLRKREQVMKK